LERRSKVVVAFESPRLPAPAEARHLVHDVHSGHKSLSCPLFRSELGFDRPSQPSLGTGRNQGATRHGCAGSRWVRAFGLPAGKGGRATGAFLLADARDKRRARRRSVARGASGAPTPLPDPSARHRARARGLPGATGNGEGDRLAWAHQALVAHDLRVTHPPPGATGSGFHPSVKTFKKKE
jgi:hypothetical protein